ncbi:MAG: hypothetical protein ACE5PM_00635 [Candidatus Hydrothermarchaeales archaeon]
MTRRILVPLRYPITKRGRRTLEKALELIKGDNVRAIFYHVNLIYKDRKINSGDLKREVEKNAEEIKSMRNISYAVEKSYLLEESILKKISNSDIDMVIMGKSMEPRWKKFIKFWGDYRLSEDIKRAARCEVMVVE